MGARKISRGERARGVLLGLAVGDRIGGPTAQAVLLAESLAVHPRFSRRDAVERYLRWWGSEGFDTGPVTEAVFGRIQQGQPLPAAVEAVHRASGGQTAGCAPAHRALPLAMSPALADTDLRVAAMSEAVLTHQDPLAGEVSAAAVRLCRALIRGRRWDQATRDAGQNSPRAVQNALLGKGELSPGGFAVDVLCAAACLAGDAGDAGAGLEVAWAFAGPANFAPVLVGAFLGARFGAEALPQSPRITPRIQQAAQALAATWSDAP